MINNKQLSHAVLHYSSQFLHEAFRKAGNTKQRHAMMDEANQVYQRHACRLDSLTRLLDELSDGLFETMNWDFQVVPLGKFDTWDAMTDMLQEAYGATIALNIDCYPNGKPTIVDKAEWVEVTNADLGRKHVIVSVWCSGTARYYPMLIIGTRNE